MRASVLRGARRLLLFIFGHLRVHTSSEHDPSDHGHPIARWLLQLGDASRSTQTLRLITRAQCWGLHRLSTSRIGLTTLYRRGECGRGLKYCKATVWACRERGTVLWGVVYGLYQLIPTSSQLAFFKAVFLFLLTTNAAPLLELCCPAVWGRTGCWIPHTSPNTAPLTEDGCLAASLPLFLDISSLLLRGEFPIRQGLGEERPPWGQCHTQPFLAQEPLQLSYHMWY